MTSVDLENARVALEAKKALYERLAGKHTGNGTIAGEGRGGDDADAATDLAEGHNRNATLSVFAGALAKVLAALKRLDDGTYGICLKCGAELDPERLALTPEAECCVKCPVPNT